MQLFFFPLSPFSHKVQLALIAKGLQYEPMPINPLDAKEAARFREIYPLGKLPVLKEGDLVVPESSVIVEYLDELSPDVRLIPDIHSEARQVRLKDRLADFYLSENAIRLFYLNLKPEDQRDSRLAARYLGQIGDCYRVIEAMLTTNEGAYFHGDQLTLADMSLLTALRIARSMVALDDYPELSRYYEQHSTLPAFQRIQQQAKQALEEVLAFLKA